MDAMTDSILYPRFVRTRLEEALEDTPVVLVHGPRQCGKTTLARMVSDAAGYEYITFDDDVQLAAGQTARLVNVAEMASAFQLSRPTIRDYVVLLERIFLLEHLPPGLWCMMGNMWSASAKNCMPYPSAHFGKRRNRLISRALNYARGVD